MRLESDRQPSALGVQHVPALPRNEYGTPLLDGAFRLAAEQAGERLICFVNTDILLPPSLGRAATVVREHAARFLVIGECRTSRVDTLLDPDHLDWRALLRGSRRRGADAIDYFLFTPGLFEEIHRSR